MRIAPGHVTRTWALLILLTILSMAAGHADFGSAQGSGVVLAVTTIKGRWMLMDFLKFRHVPSGWRILLSSWLVLVAVLAWIGAVIPLLRG